MPNIPGVSAIGITDTGLRRNLNEDAIYLDEARNCFVVSDGVGGAAAGEEASRTFVAAAARVVSNSRFEQEEDAVATIKQVFLQANTEIIAFAESNPEKRGLACTAEFLLLVPGRFVLGHVGDSRTYRMRRGELVRLTRDHSFVQQQIDLGKISEAEALTHRYRNVILRAVGNAETVDVDIIRGRAQAGDVFLLCSDGLTDMVADDEICKCLSGDSALQEKASLLIERANRAGGHDNISVIVVVLAS